MQVAVTKIDEIDEWEFPETIACLAQDGAVKEYRWGCYWLVIVLEAYSEPCKIYKMDRFARQLTTFNPWLFSPS